MTGETCVACGGGDLLKALDLGTQAPANNIRDTVEEAESEPGYPLGLNACRTCGHGQLTYAVPPERLFTSYAYVSGTSRTMLEHFRRLAAGVADLAGVGGSVVEIGSNDGTFLDALGEHPVQYVGVDPAENLQVEVERRGHPVIVGFWPDAASEVMDGCVDVVVGQNVFAHTPTPLPWLEAARDVLSPAGVIVLQTSQADMVANNEFDTVYHEHYSFYNEHSMQALAERAGLQLVCTLYPEIHGCSSLYVLGRRRDAWSNRSAEWVEMTLFDALRSTVAPASLRHAELRHGVRTEVDWRQFGYRAQLVTAELSAASTEWRQAGRTIIAAGVSAKGVTALRASGVDPDVLLDENTLKVGRWVPGLSARIEHLLGGTARRVGDAGVYVLTAWNFKREIAEKLLSAGASPSAEAVTYLPELRVRSLRQVAEGED